MCDRIVEAAEPYRRWAPGYETMIIGACLAWVHFFALLSVEWLRIAGAGGRLGVPRQTLSLSVVINPYTAQNSVC